MKKMFTKKLCFYITIALFVTIAFIFTLQTFVAKNNNQTNSRDKLQTVKEKLLSNEKEIESLTQNLSENNLAKSRAFSEILAADPSVLEDSKRMEELRDKLIVNELHVINEEGFITHSTIADYIGFDMASGEQSAAFLKIIEDPSTEIIQKPQTNVADGSYIQYIGVARKDASGFVQVGIRPEILEETLANTKIDVVLKDFDYGDWGYVFAIDKKEHTFLAHPNKDLIDKKATENGFDKDSIVGEGKINLDGTSGYYFSEEFEDMIIGTFMPAHEYYQNRNSLTIVVAISMILIFAALIILINRTVEVLIVRGVARIGSCMEKIATGDFSITVEETTTPEFVSLSENINKMVAGIRENIAENEQLLIQQQNDMETTLELVENIKNACSDLDSVSKETLSHADDIYRGSEEQKQVVGELKQVMNELADDLNSSADESSKVTKITKQAVDTIIDTQKQMHSLSDSIEHISNMSHEIEKIIDDINEIAGQTNMLALNASIEAARAGEMGKGFAVVATQVGELAARSSVAAKETTDLITNSIKAINEGLEITKSTANTFNTVVSNIDDANNGVEEIANMVRANVSIVEQVSLEITKIDDVVNRNVQISHNSRQFSENMAQITTHLTDIVRQ